MLTRRIDPNDRLGDGALSDGAQACALSIVVVSYNTKALTLDCLRRLGEVTGGMDVETWVVDNASTDGSVDAIEREYPCVKLIASDVNAGFGAANNLALKQARGRYLLLVNSDAFPEVGSIEVMCEYLDKHREVGVVGPGLKNRDGSMQRSCFRYPSPLRCWLENLWVPAVLPSDWGWGDYRRWGHDTERVVDYVIGACLLVRREVYEEVGGFDERIFMYAEEADWQKRITEAGWRIVFLPSAQVVHFAGASGLGEPVKIRHSFFESLDYYVRKHHGLVGLMLMRLAMLVGSSLRLGLWCGVWLVRPARREMALSKMRLHGWLVRRQATCFKGLAFLPSERS